jgi:hypothetical protein
MLLPLEGIHSVKPFASRDGPVAVRRRTCAAVSAYIPMSRLHVCVSNGILSSSASSNGQLSVMVIWRDQKMRPEGAIRSSSPVPLSGRGITMSRAPSQLPPQRLDRASFGAGARRARGVRVATTALELRLPNQRALLEGAQAELVCAAALVARVVCEACVHPVRAQVTVQAKRLRDLVEWHELVDVELY